MKRPCPTSSARRRSSRRRPSGSSWWPAATGACASSTTPSPSTSAFTRHSRTTLSASTISWPFAGTWGAAARSTTTAWSSWSESRRPGAEPNPAATGTTATTTMLALRPVVRPRPASAAPAPAAVGSCPRTTTPLSPAPRPLPRQPWQCALGEPVTVHRRPLAWVPRATRRSPPRTCTSLHRRTRPLPGARSAARPSLLMRRRTTLQEQTWTPC
mmetsp:Transcript_20278/g.77867  ORF Transcript_20278/g.77867 Transcript_20278/m.77867 type:complete len:214 (+) Transcript_20278:1919-2560(+)